MPAPSVSPVIVWFRRDLRLSDNPAVAAALKDGAPIIFLFIRDQIVDDMGACPSWRLGLALDKLGQRIADLGGQLILRRGAPIAVLREVIAQTGAVGLHYCRDYTPQAIARDTDVKADLSTLVQVTSHNGQLLFEPWTTETGAGSFYKVYTPFWKAVRDRDLDDPTPAPVQIPIPESQPDSETLSDWGFDASMDRGAAVVLKHTHVGEAAAQERLRYFIDNNIGAYKAERDRMDIDATSRLSENLTYGEISPRQMWHAGRQAMQQGAAGAEHFLKEIVWREFAYHLVYHSPHILSSNWREGWDAFPWRDDNADAEKWRRGETGEPIVDAAMREMYVTGTMHNRSRMIVASYLTKHLMVHWKVGMDWFAECLTDWDPASNAMGWQWVAGCGPDASPFFRVFNPQTQAEKFDPIGVYRARFLDAAHQEARDFRAASPRSWDLKPDPRELPPMVDLKEGRERALAAYKAHTANGRESAPET